MFHTFAWSQSQDTAGVLTLVDAVPDPSMTVSGKNIQVPAYAPMLLGAVGMGANITRAQLQSPSLRRVANMELVPFIPTAVPGNMFFPFLRVQSPIALDVNEQLQCLVAESVAGAERETVIAWIADKAIDPIAGDIYSLRVTAAATLTANQWTNGALVFDQVLPVGVYAVVGAEFLSTNLQAFRFVFQATTPRPGGLPPSAFSAFTPFGQRNGGWGEWGRFESTNPPTIDFLANGADAAETGVIDVIKVG